MGTTHTFGGASSLQLVHDFDPRLSADARDRGITAVIEYAEKAGFDMEVSCTSESATFRFNNMGELLVMQEVLHAAAGHTGWVHHQTFSPADADFQRAWGAEVKEVLDEAGLKHTVIEHPGRTEVQFETKAAFLMFENLAKTGYFDSVLQAISRFENSSAPEPVEA